MWDLPKLGIESVSPVYSLLLGHQEAPLVLRSSSLLPGTQSFPETLSDRRAVQVLLRKQDVPSGVASQASFFFFFCTHYLKRGCLLCPVSSTGFMESDFSWISALPLTGCVNLNRRSSASHLENEIPACAGLGQRLERVFIRCSIGFPGLP